MDLLHYYIQFPLCVQFFAAIPANVHFHELRKCCIFVKFNVSLPVPSGAAYLQLQKAIRLLRKTKIARMTQEDKKMNNNVKELNLNEMEQVNGGWLFTIAYIVVVGGLLTAMPYIANAIKGE